MKKISQIVIRILLVLHFLGVALASLWSFPYGDYIYGVFYFIYGVFGVSIGALLNSNFIMRNLSKINFTFYLMSLFLVVMLIFDDSKSILVIAIPVFLVLLYSLMVAIQLPDRNIQQDE